MLINGEATLDNLGHLEAAVKMVEAGDVEYPMNAQHLKTLLNQARQKLVVGQ